MILTNWYVITGGPSSGKTKIIDYLAFLGYSVIPEAARILIDLERSKSKTLKQIRDDEVKFQEKVLKMKIQVEKKIPPKKLTFFERGIPDSIPYLEIAGGTKKPAITASKKRKYKGIFLLEQLPFEKDYARTEDEKTAHKINKFLYQTYLNLGYQVIKIPVKPIDKRTGLILKKIRMSPL